ncbi:MAG: PAS domain S-box protein [Euryarchaeota archaeon]|nr:PAS domain S-box protein [Euryarchaeota archaeon]
MTMKDVFELEDLFFRYSEKVLAIVDQDGLVVDANRTWKNRLEYDPQEVIGSPLWDYAHNEDRDPLVKTIRDAAGDGTGPNTVRVRMLSKEAPHNMVLVEWRFVPRDGYLLAFGLPLPIPMADLSDRDLLFELSNDLMCIAGTDGYFYDLNPAWSHTLGWSLDELKSRPFLDFVHPDDKERTMKEAERLSRGNTVHRFENRYRTKGGRYRWLVWTATGDVERGRIFAVTRDITHQKNAEEALRASEDRFRSLAESAANAIISSDTTSRITFFNRSAERLFRHRAEDVVGESLTVLMPPEYREAHLDGMARFAKTGQTRIIGRTIELVGQRSDGTTFPLELNIAHWRSQGEDQFTAIIHDITARKEAAERVRQYAERMRRSNEELEQFASVASHDLQEPLGVVRSYVQLLERRLEGFDDERAKKYMHFIADGTARMQSLIEDLLSYSRVGSRGRDLVPVDTEASVRRALDQLSLRIEESAAEVTVEPLPRVMADEGQLERLFQNVISNAVKYRRPEVEPRIKIRVGGGEHGMYRFEVADNGIGIAPEHHDRVFQIFQRLHGRGEYEGTGIGLAICKKIVERHGGRIWLESEPGEGTTVKFTLPGVAE